MKYPKLTEFYTLHEINIAMSRLLNLSESVIRNSPYTIDQISARLSLNENIIRTCMNIMIDQGIWKYNAKNDTFYVDGNIK